MASAKVAEHSTKSKKTSEKITYINLFQYQITKYG